MEFRGPKSKIEEKVLKSATWRTDGQKWFDSIEKQKRSNLKEQRDRQTYRHTDRQSQRQKIIDS